MLSEVIAMVVLHVFIHLLLVSSVQYLHTALLFLIIYLSNFFPLLSTEICGSRRGGHREREKKKKKKKL